VLCFAHVTNQMARNEGNIEPRAGGERTEKCRARRPGAVSPAHHGRPPSRGEQLKAPDRHLGGTATEGLQREQLCVRPLRRAMQQVACQPCDDRCSRPGASGNHRKNRRSNRGSSRPVRAPRSACLVGSARRRGSVETGGSAPPTCRMPLGPSQDIPQADPGEGMVCGGPFLIRLKASRRPVCAPAGVGSSREGLRHLMALATQVAIMVLLATRNRVSPSALSDGAQTYFGVEIARTGSRRGRADNPAASSRARVTPSCR